jgi:hypothetical protein
VAPRRGIAEQPSRAVHIILGNQKHHNSKHDQAGSALIPPRQVREQICSSPHTIWTPSRFAGTKQIVFAKNPLSSTLIRYRLDTDRGALLFAMLADAEQ